MDRIDKGFVMKTSKPSLAQRLIRIKRRKAERRARRRQRPEKLERRTLTIEEAAQLLGVSRAACYVYAKTGAIPTITIGEIRPRTLVLKAPFLKMFEEA
jgi:hypothetical protein